MPGPARDARGSQDHLREHGLHGRPRRSAPSGRRIGGQYREGPWDRARAYWDQEHRRFKRHARIRDRRSGFGSAIDRFSTAENTSRSEVLCQPEVRADPEHRGEGRDQFPIDPDLETASEKYSRQVAGQARRAIFDIVADDFYAVYSQKNTALFTHAPLGVEESAIQRDAFRYRCVISNDMSSSI